ncbi:MAG: hypothetical protein H7289_03885 [Mucilaginibacter sp.]|nr:hypothetical protein [Mucilaginibacter sp.]
MPILFKNNSWLTFILIIIGSTIFSLSSFAQEEAIGTTAYVKLPRDAERIDKESMLVRSKNLFGNSQLQYWSKTDNLYALGDITLSLWELNHAKDDIRTLAEIKTEMLGLFGRDDSIKVSNVAIDKIRNHTYLIFKYRRGDVYYIRFISDPKKFKSLNGLMEFKKTDQEKAESKLNEILNNVFLR